MVAGAQDLTGVLLDGRYRVGELLAVGGMSRVYRGTDTRLDRSVAVKVMDGRLAADPAFRGRLEREARAMARIEHPCVVDVHDHGEDGGGLEPLVYLVMELVEGATLRDLLVERGTLALPEALAVLEPVLSALAAAHRQGFAHRDVKPENVLISRTGAVKVADFGLVTAAAAAGATRSGMIMGTPAYLSPEQVVGEGVGPRTDVYAAGVLLFEMLTGGPPFHGEHALAVAYQHVNNDVPAPSTVVPQLPPELDELVARATVRAAEDRPVDAAALLTEVRGMRAALGVPTVPVPIPTKAGGGRRPAGPRFPQPRGAPIRTGRATTTRHGAPPVPPPRATRALPTAVWSGSDDGVEGGVGGGAADLGYRRDLENGDGPEEYDELAAQPGPRGGWLAAGVGVVALLGLLAGVLGWFLGGGGGVVVPTVVGLEDQAAQRAVAAAGLVATVTERHNDGIPAGLVAESSPTAGTEVGKGTRVTLTVSTGHPRVPPIPVGAPVPAAEGILRDADLTARPDGNVRRPHPSAPVGSVIATVPPTGTELSIGAPVTLVLSKGPQRDRDRDGGGGGPLGGFLDGVLGDILGRGRGN